MGAGYYDGADARTFWIVDGGSRVGLIRLMDLADETPMFDLRLRAAHRGRGLGRAAVAWLTAYLFTELPHATRIEATTRVDNQAMRRVLSRAGWVKEAQYRRAWPVPGGPARDAVGYAILREDWAAGRRPALLEPAATVVDCRDAAPVAAFWAAAWGGEVVRRDADSASVTTAGGTVVFREVAGHRPPTWPFPDVPLQVHVDYYVDDLAEAEAELVRLGAAVAGHQAHRADGLVVLVDPAGHPFCIGSGSDRSERVSPVSRRPGHLDGC